MGLANLREMTEMAERRADAVRAPAPQRRPRQMWLRELPDHRSPAMRPASIDMLRRRAGGELVRLTLQLMLPLPTTAAPARRPSKLRVIPASTAVISQEARAALPEALTPAEQWEAQGRLPAVRPQTRADCASGPRPCPWVSCRHHLYLDVNPASGSIRLNFPGQDIDELEETCSLDVADHVGDRGETSFTDVGRYLNITLEGVRQIEIGAKTRMADALAGRRRRRRLWPKKKRERSRR